MECSDLLEHLIVCVETGRCGAGTWQAVPSLQVDVMRPDPFLSDKETFYALDSVFGSAAMPSISTRLRGVTMRDRRVVSPNKHTSAPKRKRGSVRWTAQIKPKGLTKVCLGEYQTEDAAGKAVNIGLGLLQASGHRVVLRPNVCVDHVTLSVSAHLTPGTHTLTSTHTHTHVHVHSPTHPHTTIDVDWAECSDEKVAWT